MSRMQRMKMLIEAIGMLMKNKFTGHLKINFSQGSIGRIEKYEEINDIVSTLEDEKSRNAGKE